MKRYYFYDDLLEQTHLLVTGATGSGKSTVVAGMMYTIMLENPNTKQVVLIDPKRVELSMYRCVPHCIGYASEKDDIYNCLMWLMDMCETRYKDMAAHSLKKYTGSDIYCFIDEYADLMTTDRKRTKPVIQRLCQIGRAANIHMIVCTQTPISKIIDTEIKCNIDSRIALRCCCEQDSRNIINVKDAAYLPKHGYCYYKKSTGTRKAIVPYYPETDLYQLVHMVTPPPKKKKLFGIF